MNTNFRKPKDYYSDRKEVLPFIPSDKRIFLDVGCGEGSFGSLLKQQRQAEVWGIEIDPVPAEKGKKILDRVIVDNIENEDIKIPENYFDCILFNDCLEHLHDPWSVLKRIGKYLNRGGVVVSSIPNVRYYSVISDLIKRKRWDYVDAGVLDRTHLRFFTVKTIREMFQEANFKSINIQGINAIDLPWKAGFVNWFLRGALDDMRYPQFVCVAEFKNFAKR